VCRGCRDKRRLEVAQISGEHDVNFRDKWRDQDIMDALNIEETAEVEDV